MLHRLPDQSGDDGGANRDARAGGRPRLHGLRGPAGLDGAGRPDRRLLRRYRRRRQPGVCAIPPQSANYKFPIASAQAGGEAVRVTCDNTTLNGGFNTNATPFNFLECTNVADAAVVAKVFAVDFAGQTLINGTSVTLQPGLRTDLDVHSAVGPDRFGRLFVVHDGTKQAIRCVVSRYDLDLTLPRRSPWNDHSATPPLPADAVRGGGGPLMQGQGDGVAGRSSC